MAPVWRDAINHLLHFSFALKAEIDSALAGEIGYSLADHEGLMNIAESGGALRMTDIADRLVLSPGGITKLVDRLEAAGYVRRKPSQEDRRVTMVEVTSEGRETVRRSRKVIDSVVAERWSSHVSEEESGVLLEIIRRFYRDEDVAKGEESGGDG